MSDLLRYSFFQQVLFPDEQSETDHDARNLTLQKVIRFKPPFDIVVRKTPLVVFDFETTGLDARDDQIIEIGAIRIENGVTVDEFSSLVSSRIPLTASISKLTGITPEMLEGQPYIETVLPEFLKFFSDAILIAHNAEFDMGFLKAAGRRLGYEIDWPCFCTLKLARVLLPELESKNLDSLAAHYGLVFEARHRSIGDVKVTCGVLEKFLTQEAKHLMTWQDFSPFWIKE